MGSDEEFDQLLADLAETANDCWIAAARTHNRLPLLTRNRKDFDPLTHHGLTLL